MKNQKQPHKTKRPAELDGVYVLKLVLYVVIGSLWVKPQQKVGGLVLPVGLLIGMLFASHEHFQIDRKVEYAGLVIACLVGFLAPYGLFLQL